MRPRKRPTGDVGQGTCYKHSAQNNSIPGTVPIQTLLDRLDDARESGRGQWVARCPAHEDKNPSLSLRETNDGTVLLKCWTGCSAADVVHAVGLELRDLFPGTPEHHRRLPPGARWDWRGLLLTLRAEATVVLLAAEIVRRGEPLNPNGTDRLTAAVHRICRVADLAGAGA